jgi:hypothetical protein
MKYYGTVANQLFRRIFCNSKFFGTHVHLGTLTFQKILNHKNFLEKLDLRQRHYLSALKKYAVFKGRASRADYWYFFLFSILVSIVIAIAAAALELKIIIPFIYSS